MLKKLLTSSFEKKNKNLSLRRFLLIALLSSLCLENFYGQTTLISPTGAGGFALGTTFAANGWSVSNSANNPWVVGTTPLASVPAPLSGSMAYVSSNGGTSATYIPGNISNNFFWRDVTVPAGESVISLSFNFIQNTSDATWDIWQVFLAPTTTTPVGSTTYPGSGLTAVPASLTGAVGIGGGTDGGATTVVTANLSIPPSYAGTTFRLIFAWKNDGFGTQPPSIIDNISLISSLPTTYTATAQGGLWSSPSTWVGGVVPPAGNDILIPAGSIVTVDQVTNYRNLSVSGILQWNGTVNAMNLSGNTTINSGGRLLPYTTGLGVVTMNLGGDFTNNGYANLTRTTLNFNGSQQTASMAQTLSGSGVFEGNNSHGIVNGLFFQTTGSSVINTNQNLVTYSLAHTAGSLNTNSKLTIDNTAQVYGKKINTQVISVHVTNMGATMTTNSIRLVGGTVAPIHWTASGTTTAGTLIIRDTNLYRATSTTLPSTAPTHTSGIVNNLLWVGNTGILGTPFNFSSSVPAGNTPIFYGNNLYVCIATGTPSSSAPPVHTSGTAASGAATFLYIGRAAKVVSNYDNTNKALRSLTLLVSDSGYTATPTFNFVRDSGNTAGTLPAATAVVPQSLPGNANSLMQKSGVAAISGSITINSDQGSGVLAPSSYKTSSSSGVGAVSATNGGLNYTAAPTVGFAGPTALNLVTNSGSGYTTAPTITVTGGILISGTALTTSNFTITVNQGKVVSVYLNAGTTATYSTPPTLSFTAGGGSGATLNFPSGCWPAATAIIGSNGQITNFNVTSSGYGYVAAPTVGVGVTSGSGANSGGTFSLFASGLSARLGMYNLTLNFFAPAVTAVVQTDIPQVIPSNRKLNALSLSGNGNGLNITADSLLIYGSAPFSLISSFSIPGNILDLGGKTIHFSWNGYAGTTNGNGASNSFIRNGSMTLTTRGGGTTGKTIDFPFDGQSGIPFRYFTGTGTGVSDGADVLTVKVT